MLALLWSTITLHAQTQQDPYAAEKVKIREIKLSGEYYYSDVSSADIEDLQATARHLLALSVQERERTSKEVSKVVADSCRYIHLKLLDRPRVFAYVSKEAGAVYLFGKPQTTTSPTVLNVPMARKDTTKVTIRDTVRVTVQDTTKVMVRDTVRVVLQDTTRVVVRDTTHVTDTVRKQLEIRTTGNDRLDRIARMKTIKEVEAYFIAEKKAGRMMFGKMKTAVRPESCYLLVFSKTGDVVAVLDRGEKSRRNLITGKRGDRVENYPGHGVIWFTIH